MAAFRYSGTCTGLALGRVGKFSRLGAGRMLDLSHQELRPLRHHGLGQRQTSAVLLVLNSTNLRKGYHDFGPAPLAGPFL